MKKTLFLVANAQDVVEKNNMNLQITESIVAKKLLLMFLVIFFLITSTSGQMVSTAGYEDGTIGSWTGQSASETITSESSIKRTGAYSLKLTTTSTSAGRQWYGNNPNISTSASIQSIHVIYWALNGPTATNVDASTRYSTSSGVDGTDIAINSSTWTRITSVSTYNGVRAYYLAPKRSASAALSFYIDDHVIYSSTSTTTDIISPNAPTSVSGSYSNGNALLTWSSGGDNTATGTTGVQATLVLKYTGAGTPSAPSLNNQANYSVNDVPNTDWIVVKNDGGAAGSNVNVGAISSNTTYAIYHRDLAYNWSTGATTLVSLLATPATPTASNQTISSFDLTFSPVTNATSYKLDVSTLSDFSSLITGYNDLTVTSPTTVSSLNDGTTYYFRLRAVGSSGPSANSTTGSTSTLSLSAPSATAATSISPSGFIANWDAVAGASSYRLDVSTSPSFTTTALLINEGFENATFPPTGWTTTSWTRSTTVGDFINGVAAAVAASTTGTLTTAAVANPTSMTFYLGRSANSSAKTLTVEVSTTSQTTGFTTVATYDHSNVPASTYNQYSLDLSAYTSNPVVYIRFVKASSTTSPWRLDDLVVNGSVPSLLLGYNNLTVNGTSQAVTGLTPNTDYYYRVRAVGANSSANSNVISVHTPCPSATITYTIDPCATTGTASPTLTGTSGGTYLSTSGLVISSTGVIDIVASTAGTYNVTYTFTGSCGQYITTTSVIIKTNTWTGATDIDWFIPGNWSCNYIPTLATNVVIPGSLSTYPVITGSTPAVANSITIASGASLTNNATLQFNGNISNSGTLDATNGTLFFNGTTAQAFISSVNAAANNITYDNAAGVSLSGAGKLYVRGVITPTAGTLTTGGKLVLKSDANGTARIAQGSGNYITGNVIVERYISSLSNRAYRLLAPSVTTTTSIHANWQEGATANSNDPLPLYGTHITGSTVDQTNGFDATQTGAASLFNYNQAAPAWTGIANTDVLTLDAKSGYLLFVRGDRTLTNITTATGSTNTTLRATGTVLTGDQSHTLQPNVNDFTLVTNPYPSPISWTSIYGDASTTGLSSAYTLWDPNVGIRGGYVTVTDAGVKNNMASNATIEIQSGQAFFVQASAASPTLTIKETHKSATSNIDVFRTGSQEQLYTSLYFNMPDGNRRVADGVNSVFNNNYSTALGTEDIQEIGNFDENIAILRNSKMLSIEGRPLVDNADTVFLSIARLKVQSYEWQFNPISFNAPGLQAYLQDKFTNNETPISLSTITVISFSVTSVAGSSAADRFRIVFRMNGVLPVNLSGIKAYSKDRGIQVEWSTATESNMDRHEIERSLDGRQFTKAGSVVAKGNSTTLSNYNWFDVNPSAGSNFYRIRSVDKTGQASYSQVVRVNLSKDGGEFTIYPNPVKGNTISIGLNLEKGKYTLSLINSLGQQVFTTVLEHQGGAAAQTLNVPMLSTGVYNLKITSNNKNIIRQIIKN